MKLSNLNTVMALATAGPSSLTAHADATVHNHHHKIFTLAAVPPHADLKIKEGDYWVTSQSPKMAWFSTAKQ